MHNFGSGIVGHIISFLRYTETSGTKTRLQKEMYRILDVQRQLGLPNVPNIADGVPIDLNFAIITLGCEDVNNSRSKMCRYLFEDERRKPAHSAQMILRQYDRNIEKTEKGFKLTNNRTGSALEIQTLFSTETIDSMNDKADIFDADRYEVGL